MARLFTSFLILFVGFVVTAAPKKLSIIEIGLKEVRALLTKPLAHPGDQLKIETDVQLVTEAPEMKLPRTLKMTVPGDLQSNTHYAVTHGLFAVPVAVEKVIQPEFWKFENFQRLLKDYEFTINEELANGTNGSVAVPIGFTFGIAPSELICNVQLRVQKGGSGPTATFAINESWGQPLATIYQLNSDCNMFFAGFLTVSSIYRLNDGTAGVLAQSFLYVNDSAVEKLNKVRFLAGPPGKAIGDKIKDQTTALVKALRQLQAENKK